MLRKPVALRPLPLHPLFTLLTLLFFLSAGPRAQILGPYADPAYHWQPTLAAAAKAAGKDGRIVIYSVLTTSLRDQAQWLALEADLWKRPELANLLSGVPLVALNSHAKANKKLGLPQFGFAVAAADGKSILAKIEFQGSSNVGILDRLRSALGKHAGTKATLSPQVPTTSIPELLRARIRERKLKARDYWQKLPAPRPTRNQVVVVNDARGFLDAISGWSRESIYPVLFADSRYLPKFLRQFQASKVWIKRTKRRASTQITEEHLLSTWAQCCGVEGVVTEELPGLEAWRKLPDRSPGVVVTSVSDPMCLAGLALAIGRRQGLIFMPPVAKPAQMIQFDAALALRKTLSDRLDAAQIEWDQLYDELDFVTLACAQPYRYQNRSYADKTPFALDDFLTRREDELRWAHTGRLYGDTTRAVYQAMCSLFLQPARSLLFSRYSKNSQPWKTYDTAGAKSFLAKHLAVEEYSHPKATRDQWQQLFAQENGRWGLVHVNSSGGARTWSTSKGKADYDDIFETLPCIVSYTHSGSAAAPYDADSIAGRWLERGAYIFFGSCSEPYLDAFVPIDIVYKRAISEGAPLASCFRWPAGLKRWRPWKLAYFGDPLRRLLPKRSPRLPAMPDGTKQFGPELGHAGRKNPFARGKAARPLETLLFPALAKDKPPSLRTLMTALKKLKPGKLDAKLASDWADLLALTLRHTALSDKVDKPVEAASKVKLHSRALSLALHDRALRLAYLAAKSKDSAQISSALELALKAQLGSRLAGTTGAVLATRLSAAIPNAKERKSLITRLRKQHPAKTSAALLKALR
ncbi:MAG: hypothetical protein CSA62_05680 [Planctomycetota bacterium]|nr:MAG: hypothetical protein CSA62_05680 [Planctomycetota bacterium]